MALFRVSFQGVQLTDDATAAMAARLVTWERTEYDPDGRCAHTALANGATASDAVEAARQALAGHGSFGSFSASPVRDAHGRVHRGPVYLAWSEIEWDREPARAKLTTLQRAVIATLLHAAEPTWLVASDNQITTDQTAVEAALDELQSEALIGSHLEPGGQPGKEDDNDRWWSITDEGWDVLGLIKRPGYH